MLGACAHAVVAAVADSILVAINYRTLDRNLLT